MDLHSPTGVDKPLFMDGHWWYVDHPWVGAASYFTEDQQLMVQEYTRRVGKRLIVQGPVTLTGDPGGYESEYWDGDGVWHRFLGGDPHESRCLIHGCKKFPIPHD